MWHGNGFADSDCTVFFGRVASIGGVDPGVECCQGSLLAPAQTVEVESRGRPV